MVPLSHHPDCNQHPLRLNKEFTYGVTGHLLRYGCLPPPDVLSNGVKFRGVHFRHQRGYYHSPPDQRVSVIPVIRLAAC